MPTTPAAAEAIKKKEREFLRARDLVNAFGKAGMVCSVVEPASGDDTTAIASAATAAERADVLVLDWFIHESDVGGDMTTAIVRKVVARDKAVGGRLRLIAVYTGEPDVEKVLSKLAAALKEEGLPLKREGHALHGDTLRVAVLLKPGAAGAGGYDDTLNQLVVAEPELPRALISHFARMTGGIVSNACLKSMSILRGNTHAVLAHLNAGLDPGFLHHRALQDTPEDSTAHLEEVIVTEIGSILASKGAAAVADDRMIERWVLDRPTDFLDDKKIVDRPALVKLLVHGKGDGGHGLGDAVKRLSCILGDAGRPHDRPDDAFAAAASMIRAYGAGPSPMLLTGTVVRDLGWTQPAKPPEPQGGKKPVPPDEIDTFGAYLICVQPICDCVRVGTTKNRVEANGRPFLFLPTVETNDAPFDFILQVEHGKFVRLLKAKKSFHIKPIRFRQNSSNATVVVSELDGKRVFVDSDDRRYEWVGQMKPAHALKLSQELATDLSRVGLNESEWLRLKARK